MPAQGDPARPSDRRPGRRCAARSRQRGRRRAASRRRDEAQLSWQRGRRPGTRTTARVELPLAQALPALVGVGLLELERDARGRSRRRAMAGDEPRAGGGEPAKAQDTGAQPANRLKLGLSGTERADDAWACTGRYARADEERTGSKGFGSTKPSRRRDSNPRPPLYESAQRGETEGSEGSSEGINALQIRLF
jgi:hypothetical protein